VRGLLDYAAVISFHVLISLYQPVVGPQLFSFIALTPRDSPSWVIEAMGWVLFDNLGDSLLRLFLIHQKG